MKLLELSFLFICLFSVSAEENLRLPDTRALALGGNGVTLSSFSNPALVQLSTDKVIHLEYFNRYALKELGSINGSSIPEYLFVNRYSSGFVRIRTVSAEHGPSIPGKAVEYSLDDGCVFSIYLDTIGVV